MSDERLARIETLLEHLTTRVEENHSEADLYRRDLKRTIYGDGNGYKGLLVRIDRLEQDLQSRKKREAVLFTAVVGLLAKAVFTLLA